MNAPHRRKEWLEFKSWCAQRNLKPFPAHPWTVATYALWLDANRRYRTLQKRLDVIARVHIRACVHDPEHDGLVMRTLQAIEDRRNQITTTALDGTDLIAPKKRKLSIKEKSEKPSMRQVPPLVSRRPHIEN